MSLIFTFGRLYVLLIAALTLSVGHTKRVLTAILEWCSSCPWLLHTAASSAANGVSAPFLYNNATGPLAARRVVDEGTVSRTGVRQQSSDAFGRAMG